jgi:hypothetical protein
MEDRISVWEGEGGSINEAPTGSVNPIEWAERIKARVDGEFDRVASVLDATARNQSERDRSDTLAMMTILEDKRAAVMANQSVGYFMHDWQELRDQVRRMIMSDGRYEGIKARQRGLRPLYVPRASHGPT